MTDTAIPALQQDLSKASTNPRIPRPDQAIMSAIMRIESVFGRSDAGNAWAKLITASKDSEYAAAFLIATMPRSDLEKLDPTFVQENIRLALVARQEFSWAKELEEWRFLNDVLPYAVLDEDRDSWRADLLAKLRPVVAKCKTRREAILAVNAALRDIVKVEYNTKRRAANQSPPDSIRQGVASCTGLSILLCDAFRAVGIPARIAGVPTWVTVEGNHNWVEVWDGEWMFTEYYPDKKGLNHGWLLERASYADPARTETWVYATSWAPTGLYFPIVWNLNSRMVAAVNRTTAYHAYAGGRKYALTQQECVLGLRVFKDGKRVPTTVTVMQGGKSLATVKTADDTQDMMDVPWVKVRMDGGAITVIANTKEVTVTPKAAAEVVVDVDLGP
jgi:transglutaminase-like putative cysteine protease